MLRIAITGNIASGKSQVESFIGKYYPTFDSDKIAHEILTEIRDFYGYDVFTNGIIDRIKLGKLIFTNNDLKKKLENLIHPKVKDKILKIFEQNKDFSAVFVSVPLLYEAGFETLFDKVIFVTADENLRLERLMKRNGLTKEEAIQRINAQLHENEKVKKADYVINNNSTLEEMEKQVRTILKDLFG